MIQAVSSGEHPLTRDIFLKALTVSQPSKKDEIIRSLDSWDAETQKRLEG